MNAKKNGVYYTPPKLAEYLVAPLLDDRELKILDPSYGEGALLLASERVCTKANYENKIQLFGCDIKPINGLLKHLPDANIEKKDFFDYPIAKKFDLILMNPPYVRHHIQNENKIKRYRKIIPELDSLNNFSDLWAYFLVKAMCHLKEGGSIGAILPWSFLQADYAQKLRADLFKKFGNIKALALTEKYFENADERVVLLWLKKFGESCGSLEMGSANTIKDTIKYSSLPLSNWSSNKVLYNGNTSTEDILFRYKNEFGFSEFKNYADVKIGVVTGADKYFIVSKSKAKELGFESRHLIPILTKSKNFSELHGGADNLKQLIYLTERNYKKFKSFINQGKKNEYNLRAHSTLRDPWYKVKVGNIPDGFFPYRAAKFPYLLRNVNRIQCTNSIHRIYFKKLSATEKKWIQISLLSVAGQLSLEAYSKTYGRGILKIEPSSLKRTLVLKKSDKTINTIFSEVERMLLENDRIGAMRIATDFINKQLAIPTQLSIEAENALYQFQAHRLSSTESQQNSQPRSEPIVVMVF